MDTQPKRVDASPGPERVRAYSAELQADLDRLYAEISEMDDAIDERRRQACDIELRLDLIRERFPALTKEAEDARQA